MTYQSFALLLLTLSPSLHASDFGDPELGKMKSPSCVSVIAPRVKQVTLITPNFRVKIQLTSITR